MKYKQSGFTLIELLISLALGSLLLGGIIELYAICNTNIYHQQQNIDSIANLNLAINHLTYDIEHAGSMGCKAYRYYQNIDNPFSNNTTIGGINKQNIFLVEKQENITINTIYAGNPQTQIITQLPLTNQIAVPYNADIKNNQYIIISDCFNLSFNKIIKVNLSKKNYQKLLTLEYPIKAEYNDDAIVYPLIIHEYNIIQNQNKQSRVGNDKSLDSYSLTVKDQSGNSDELISNLGKVSISISDLKRPNDYYPLESSPNIMSSNIASMKLEWNLASLPNDKPYEVLMNLQQRIG